MEVIVTSARIDSKGSCAPMPTPQDLAKQRHTPDERVAFGRSLRANVPRTSHRLWDVQEDRPDPVRLLEEQNAERVPWLVPLRHGRMGVSPFTFYRGTARIMAADLATTPSSGLTVQLGGDAHLSNFGAYGSPERQLVFDANDFDETLPGPWECCQIDVPAVLRDLRFSIRHKVERDTRRTERLDAMLRVADHPATEHRLPELGNPARVLAVDDYRAHDR